MIRLVHLVCLAALALAGCDSAADGGAQETAASDARSAAQGDFGTPGELVRTFAGTRMPPLVFEDPDGNTLDLGKLEGPVLINLWATWCAPCVAELPMLDNLAGELNGELRVITISQDVRGARVVVPFFEARDFQHIEPWLDPDTDLGATFAQGGSLPITILFGANKEEILRVAGEYEWDSEEAIAQLREALAETDPAT